MNPKSKLLQRRAVRSTSSWTCAYCEWCNNRRSCGTLHAPAAIIFLLTLEYVTQLWIRYVWKLSYT